mmetsp:Transcript_14178/g.48875  ORF Transcript_14178/g.48875 Transcript_14178/m.48875 type:complete len:124 (+) Transcript_14178:140-511(+)
MSGTGAGDVDVESPPVLQSASRDGPPDPKTGAYEDTPLVDPEEDERIKKEGFCARPCSAILKCICFVIGAVLWLIGGILWVILKLLGCCCPGGTCCSCLATAANWLMNSVIKLPRWCASKVPC